MWVWVYVTPPEGLPLRPPNGRSRARFMTHACKALGSHTSTSPRMPPSQSMPKLRDLLHSGHHPSNPLSASSYIRTQRCGTLITTSSLAMRCHGRRLLAVLLTPSTFKLPRARPGPPVSSAVDCTNAATSVVQRHGPKWCLARRSFSAAYRCTAVLVTKEGANEKSGTREPSVRNQS